MLRRALLCALVLSLTIVAPALASPRSDHDPRHHALTSRSDRHGDRGDLRNDQVWDRYSSRDDEDTSDSGSDGADESDTGDSTTDTGSDVTDPVTGTQAVTGGTVATGTQQTITADLTGFAKFDNSPANSVTISQPVIHQTAGGSGTFQDPITAASPGSAGSTESPKGTRFYLPSVHRYVIIEDSGASKMSHLHLDVWNGTVAGSITTKCESDMTGTFQIIRNPPPGLTVHPGPLATESGCHF